MEENVNVTSRIGNEVFENDKRTLENNIRVSRESNSGLESSMQLNIAADINVARMSPVLSVKNCFTVIGS